MVEAEISPEMIKRKKKKKKRRKELHGPAEEAATAAADHQAYPQREFGRSSVPRLPKLPSHPRLVANLREQQRRQQMLEDDVLPGSYPDFPPSPGDERCRLPPYRSSSGRGVFSDRPEDLGLAPRCPPGTSFYAHEGLSERMAHVARVPAGRRVAYGPIHSHFQTWYALREDLCTTYL